MADELGSLLTFVLGLLRDYGLEDFYLELSTRDPEKSVGTDEAWEEATAALQAVADASGLELVPDPGGAAFYGPKISVQARDAIGRTWQMSTIQVDFNLPERFDLEYAAADGTRQRPVMLHRALFGSIERFFAVLLEHYAGAFPAWLAPVQVVGIPVHSRLRRLPARGRGEAARAGRPGRGRHLRRPHAEEDPHRAEVEGAVHAHRRRGRRHQGRRLVPLPRRDAGERRPGRRGRREGRRRGGVAQRDRRAGARRSRRGRRRRRLRPALHARTGWPTSRARARAATARSARSRRCSDEDGLVVARGASWRTSCSTSTRTTPAT